jgi:nicotinate-nucleotide pyrophosphorylase (carboxylating)
LIKDNHISAAGGIKNVVKNIKEHNSANLQIELEVATVKQLTTALDLGIKGFLLDNMQPTLIKECVDIIRSQPDGSDIFIEASGGITYENLTEYAETGVNAISIGALTHRIKSANIHLIFLDGL